MPRGREESPPPPPPNPQLAEAMLTMSNLLGQLVRGQQQTEARFAQQDFVQRVTLRDFLSLNPKNFDTPKFPLDADDWLRGINLTLVNAKVAEEDKVSFASYMLTGESAAWWETVENARDPNVPFSWAEFQKLFRDHHIPQGELDRMKEEFMKLTQGSNNVLTYSKQFTLLARYAGDEISTDEKKQARFRNGLEPSIKFSLNLTTCKNFEELVNMAIKAETGRREYERTLKHARELGSATHSGPPQRRRVYQQEAPQPARTSYQQRQPRATPRPQMFQQRPPQGYIRQGAQPQQQQYLQQQPRTPFGAPQRPYAPRPITCFKCGEPGHKSPACPNKEKLPPPPPLQASKAMVRVPPPQQKAFNENNRPTQRNVMVNNVMAEEAEQAPDVVIEGQTDEYQQEFEQCEYPLEFVPTPSFEQSGTCDQVDESGPYYVDYADEDYCEQ